MNWIDTEDRLPESGQVVLTTNHAFLDPSKERYFAVAQFRDGEYVDPETFEVFFDPDYWCEIVGPAGR